MRRVAVLLVSATLVGGCASERHGGSSSTVRSVLSSPTPTTSAAPRQAPTTPRSTTPAPTVTVVTTAISEFGPILFDRTGQAIYTFDIETSSKPACYGDCALAWPPVLTTGEPVAGGAVRPGLLGVTSRIGGHTQVTYGGKPLYFYAHEGKHQVLCHNVTEYGGRWLAVTAAANPAPT